MSPTRGNSGAHKCLSNNCCSDTQPMAFLCAPKSGVEPPPTIAPSSSSKNVNDSEGNIVFIINYNIYN